MATGRNVSRYKRPFYWTASVLLVMVLLRGYVTFYFANAIEAWIIDAETRKPVEGAVVVARWTLEYEGGADYDMVVLETVTDKNGRFTFPAWGPQPKPVSLPWDARLKYADPEVKFYKFGYAGTKRTPSIGRKKSMHVLVTMDYTVHGPSVRGWALNGETFEYKPAKGDLKLLTEELYEFHRELNRLHGGGCEYMHIPRALNAVKNGYAFLLTQTEEGLGESPIRHGRRAHMKWIDVDSETLNLQRDDCGMTAAEAMKAAQ